MKRYSNTKRNMINKLSVVTAILILAGFSFAQQPDRSAPPELPPPKSLKLPQIEKFESAIQNGEVLMMIDVPKTRVEEIEALIQQHHPDADMGGTEPHIPAFP